MEYLIGLIVILLGGIFHFKGKADEKAIDAKLASAKGKDSVLAEEEFDLKKAIAEIDANIEKAKKEREEAKSKERTENLTLSEIKARLKKGQGIR